MNKGVYNSLHCRSANRGYNVYLHKHYAGRGKIISYLTKLKNENISKKIWLFENVLNDFSFRIFYDIHIFTKKEI